MKLSLVPHRARGFRQSRSFSYFLIFLVLALISSMALAVAYFWKSQQAYIAGKHEEKQAILRLIDSFVATYSDLHYDGQHFDSSLPPATYLQKTLSEFLRNSTGSEEIRVHWVGVPGRQIRTGPMDTGMAAILQEMAQEEVPRPVTKQVLVGSSMLLRSVFPSPALRHSCIDCHNRIQQTGLGPAWKLGELMGGFVLDVPIDRFLSGLRWQSLHVGGVFFALFAMAGYLLFRQHHFHIEVAAENRVLVEISEALETIDDGIAVYARDGHLLLANQAYRRRHGMSEGDRFHEAVMKTSTEEKGHGSKWLKVDEARTASGLLVCLETDVTYLKEREKELVAARVAAEQAGKARSDFLAMMSHELRTPLNAILGFSEMIRDCVHGPAVTKYKEYASDIHSSGRHLLQLITDILDMSKVDAGRIDLVPEPVLLEDVFDDCRRLVEGHARQCGVHIGIEPADEIVSVDPLRFRQIMLNLLSNAIKYTRAGGRVTIATTRDSGHIRVAVRDTGIGMAPQDIPRALERFVQVGNSRQHAAGGTGLGLPLAKALAELHGGSLTVESRLGVGTTVTVALPAHAVPARSAGGLNPIR